MNFLVAAVAVYGAYVFGRNPEIPGDAIALGIAVYLLARYLDRLEHAAPPPPAPPLDPPCATCPEPLSAHPPDGPCSMCSCPGWAPRKDPA